MKAFDPQVIQKLHTPHEHSHKAQNGKLLLIGGSHLFHAASLWALTIASRIVDMVFYSSVPENDAIVQKAKEEFRNGIVIKREDIDDYANEADCILIGPGMMRKDEPMHTSESTMHDVKQIQHIEDEGEQTYWMTKYMLQKHAGKKFVLDAGALQMMDPEWLRALEGKVILTPHAKEFERLFVLQATPEHVQQVAREYNCVIVLKGKEDIVCSPDQCVRVAGGNAGMTKGGTGDVLAGLIAALACTNDVFLSACVGSYFNKKAGDALFAKVGYYFNASDLANELPSVMRSYIVHPYA